MRWTGIVVFGLLFATACTPSLPTDPSSASSTSESQAMPQRQLFDEESAAMAAYPAVARREDGQLLIRMAGRDVVRLSDSAEGTCEDYQTCYEWTFRGVFRLRESGSLIDHAVVKLSLYEGGESIIIAPDGRIYGVGLTPLVSPDGRYIADGETNSLLGPGFFRIIDWEATPRTVDIGQLACEAVTWNETEKMTITCSADEDGAESYQNMAVLNENRWHLVDVAGSSIGGDLNFKTENFVSQNQASYSKVGLKSLLH